MHIFHKWSKWEEYREQITGWLGGKLIPSYEHWQKRYCLKCGYTERREVN